MMAVLLRRLGERPRQDRIVNGLKEYAAAIIVPSSGLNLGEASWSSSAIVFRETALIRSSRVKSSEGGKISNITSSNGA